MNIIDTEFPGYIFIGIDWAKLYKRPKAHKQPNTLMYTAQYKCSLT
jgi:hypothetical protein